MNAPDDHEALRRFHEINTAYEVLGDARARRDYDIHTFGRRGAGNLDDVGDVSEQPDMILIMHQIHMGIITDL